MFWIGFFIGLIVGMGLGLVGMSLLSISKEADREAMEELQRMLKDNEAKKKTLS